MMDQQRDQISLLEEIRLRLERLENQHWGRAIQKIDIGQFSIDLRRARIGSFPDGYFTGNTWDVLLELYQAKRSGKNMQLTDVATSARISESLALRFIDLLMADGFLYQEEHPIDRSQTHIVLTKKATTQIEQLFEQIQVRIGSLVGSPNTAENDTVVAINQSLQAG